jgi:hypothetical protein
MGGRGRVLSKGLPAAQIDRRSQREKALRVERNFEPNSAVRRGCEVISDRDPLTLAVDVLGTRDASIVEAIPAVPAGAVAAHLNEPRPDARWRGADRHGHRRAALAARN